MALTVEPGIYIAAGTKGVPKRWWNIGIRIEDDVAGHRDRLRSAHGRPAAHHGRNRARDGAALTRTAVSTHACRDTTSPSSAAAWSAPSLALSLAPLGAAHRADRSRAARAGRAAPEFRRAHHRARQWHRPRVPDAGRLGRHGARGRADPQDPRVRRRAASARAHRRGRAGLEALGLRRAEPRDRRGAVARPARAPTVEVIAPARVTGSELDGDAPRRSLRTSRARRARSAPGWSWPPTAIRSLVRDQAGIDADHIDYEQVAIIAAVMTTQRFHDYVAYERFTAEGPIAILPLTDGRCRHRLDAQAGRGRADARAAGRRLPARVPGGVRLPARALPAHRPARLVQPRALAGRPPRGRSGSPSSAMPRRDCIRSRGRASTWDCATR